MISAKKNPSFFAFPKTPQNVSEHFHDTAFVTTNNSQRIVYTMNVGFVMAEPRLLQGPRGSVTVGQRLILGHKAQY